jgi:NAD(P)H-hydrate epimerase
MHKVRTSPKDVRAIVSPKPNSHKWQNGSVLIIGGSHRYHGALMFAARTASAFVDMVHIASPENYGYLLPKLRQQSMTFIPVFRKELGTYIGHVDVVLMGPGLEVNPANRKLINQLLRKYPEKRFVLDAGAFRMANLKYVGPHCICTPNAREFVDIFGTKLTSVNVRALVKKFHTNILAKSAISFIAAQTQFAENHAGHPGLTKGGTGDVLAGLVASFFTKNDAFVSMKAASLLLGKTAEKLAKQRSYAYSAEDLLGVVPEVFGRLRRGSRERK